MTYSWKCCNSITEIEPDEFEQIKNAQVSSVPFLNYEFLLALEETGCVGQRSGWQVNHLVVVDSKNELVAFTPAYIKSHSYGEYVFDHSWANAFHQHGLEYYPKLVLCLPFTPITACKIMCRNPKERARILTFIAENAQNIMQSLDVSSLHALFFDQNSSQTLLDNKLHQRLSVQFNWHNKDYLDFEHYLSFMTARRRKSIKKERSAISKMGVTIHALTGDQISDADLQFFYHCYQHTYAKKSGHGGYLNKAFFEHIHRSMSEHLLLVVARYEERNIAAALFFHDKQALYGRYWGALKEISGLHFEACYYQGIEFCIKNNIAFFNPGTQGEHKILRGFEPNFCYSNHSILIPEFDEAVANFVDSEKAHIEEYKRQSESLLPFKQAGS